LLKEQNNGNVLGFCHFGVNDKKNLRYQKKMCHVAFASGLNGPIFSALLEKSLLTLIYYYYF
jgi:hypothetical protein